ncbi:permease prefix domain 1-containing protein [Isoptericola jiangsuensis]|uniref:permease prefix domain 1-containing protein n=1 Tax=Isoptericola jiangsuensis TaxID=548579 RepID=UPI003AB04C8B
MDEPTALETQVERWQDYVRRHRAIAPADVDEMTDHLRERIADLQDAGLDDDEAFLVAVKRMGRLDAVSHEFAQAHSERLWKQLVLVPEEPIDGPGTRTRELGVVLALAVGAGTAVKIAAETLADVTFVANVAFLVLPFLLGYLVWKRRPAPGVVVTLAAVLAACCAVVNLYPFDDGGSTMLLAVVHAPVVVWAVVGVAYAGGLWRSADRRMDFVRFTGELAIYFALLALGGGVLIALTFGLLSVVDVDLEPAMEGWIMPFCVPGAFLVAAWLVEAKQEVVENIAPVLTKVFTPLTTVMLVVSFGVLVASGGLTTVDRELLILLDAVLVLVLALLLYSISARDPLTRPGLFDALQLVLVCAALAVDALALTAMLTRIAEFGASPNKVAALGLNLLLLVHLVRTGWLLLGFCRHRRGFRALERWQTTYLPVYAVWAAFVVVAFGPLFAFA